MNPEDKIYLNRNVKVVMDRFFASIKTSYKLFKKTIDLNKYKFNTFDFEARKFLNELAPFTEEFNIIILPTRKYYFYYYFYGEHIILIVSLHSSNPNYSVAFNYTPLTLIRYYLLEGRPLSFTFWLYRKIKQDGKKLMIICSTVFENKKQLNILRKKVYRMKTKNKLALHQIVLHKIKKVEMGYVYKM